MLGKRNALLLLLLDLKLQIRHLAPLINNSMNPMLSFLVYNSTGDLVVRARRC
jgi:hypothetical protein